MDAKKCVDDVPRWNVVYFSTFHTDFFSCPYHLSPHTTSGSGAAPGLAPRRVPPPSRRGAHRDPRDGRGAARRKHAAALCRAERKPVAGVGGSLSLTSLPGVNVQSAHDLLFLTLRSHAYVHTSHTNPHLYPPFCFLRWITSCSVEPTRPYVPLPVSLPSRWCRRAGSSSQMWTCLPGTKFADAWAQWTKRCETWSVLRQCAKGGRDGCVECMQDRLLTGTGTELVLVRPFLE